MSDSEEPMSLGEFAEWMKGFVELLTTAAGKLPEEGHYRDNLVRLLARLRIKVVEVCEELSPAFDTLKYTLEHSGQGWDLEEAVTLTFNPFTVRCPKWDAFEDTFEHLLDNWRQVPEVHREHAKEFTTHATELIGLLAETLRLAIADCSEHCLAIINRAAAAEPEAEWYPSSAQPEPFYPAPHVPQPRQPHQRPNVIDVDDGRFPTERVQTFPVQTQYPGYYDPRASRERSYRPRVVEVKPRRRRPRETRQSRQSSYSGTRSDQRGRSRRSKSKRYGDVCVFM